MSECVWEWVSACESEYVSVCVKVSNCEWRVSRAGVRACVCIWGNQSEWVPFISHLRLVGAAATVPPRGPIEVSRPLHYWVRMHRCRIFFENILEREVCAQSANTQICALDGLYKMPIGSPLQDGKSSRSLFKSSNCSFGYFCDITFWRIKETKSVLLSTTTVPPPVNRRIAGILSLFMQQTRPRLWVTVC